MERFANSWGAIIRFTLLSLVCGVSVEGFAQNSPKSYIECNHDSLITVLRAYEDSLALAGSTTVVRVDYALRVTDVAVVGKVYKIYRCEALYDSLEVLLEALMDRVAFARMTPPTVDTDSIGSISGTGATFYGKVTSDGDTVVTAQWFKYGLSAGSLSDSLAVGGVVTPFSAVASGLANGTTYYVAAFAKNVKGTSPGDTLSFTTHAAPTVDTDAATSVTETTATLNATITATGGAAVSATGFKYATNSALTTPTDIAGSGTSSPFTGSLTGLTASTQYWAVGYATNSVGTSYGDTITFTTNAVAPTVDTDAATSVTETTATLNATITATGGAAVSATGFKYATNSALTTPTDIAGSGTSSPFTGSLTGLTASTQYWAVGYATNSVGTSYGDTITFTTSVPAGFTCGTSTVTYDGHAYTTALIGSQCWFKENLRNDNYNDGTAISGSLNNSTWTSTTSGAQTVYGQGGVNEATNLATYGRLYNWYAVTDAAGLCPSGWHVPTDTEWTAVETQLGGASGAGAAMKASSSDSPAWNGTNSSGFSALPGGYRTYDNGNFANLGNYGDWWSSSPSGSDAWNRNLFSGSSGVTRYHNYVRYGFSVRCLQDAAPTVDTDAASSVTETTATLNATITVTGGAAVSATGFKYATNSALTTPTDIAGSGTSSPFTGSLTGLTASTQYWAVSYATNSVGTSYGDTITFTTRAPFTCGTSTLTYDGHAYTTVLIGSQCWFKENLRNDNYNDGTAILGNLNNSTWTSTTSGAQTVYDQGGANEASNLTTYGRLYNWYAVTNAAGLCPTGWHVPTDAEWTALETHLGGASGAGAAMKASSSDSPAWNGTNSSVFSALPGGYRTYDNGNFANLGNYGDWWSSSPSGSHAWNRNLFSGSSGVTRYHNYVRYGFSVRCLQDAAPTVDTGAATSVTETTATLNAIITATGSAAVSATGFKYATNSALTTPSDVAGSGTSSPFTGSLSSLSPGTQYWAVGYATNSVGTSYGDTITFTTPSTCGTSTVTYDGHAYATVLIGTQCWFAENLQNDNYRDGTVILGSLDASQWMATTTGACAVQDQGGPNEATNLATYGRLYNWYAVNDAAGLCPTGWHVPTDTEWTALETHLGGSSVAGGKMKTASWGGDNSSGFSGLAGGERYNGNFYNIGAYGVWWSSTPYTSYIWARYLDAGNSIVHRYNYDVLNGFSVRCLRD